MCELHFFVKKGVIARDDVFFVFLKHDMDTLLYCRMRNIMDFSSGRPPINWKTSPHQFLTKMHTPP